MSHTSAWWQVFPESGPKEEDPPWTWWHHFIGWGEESQLCLTASSLLPTQHRGSSRSCCLWTLAARIDCTPLWAPKPFLLRLNFISTVVGKVTNVVQGNPRNSTGWQSLLFWCVPLHPGCPSALDIEHIEYPSLFVSISFVNPSPFLLSLKKKKQKN